MLRTTSLRLALALVLFAIGACRSAPSARAPADAGLDDAAMLRAGRHRELRDRLRAAPAPRSPDEATRRRILLARVQLDLALNWNAATFEDVAAALEGEPPEDARLAAELVQATGELVFWRQITGQGDGWPGVEQVFDRAIELRTAIGDRHGIAESTFYRGLPPSFTGRLEEARVLFERSREIARTLDDPNLLSYPVRHLGDLADTEGNLEAALALHTEVVALRERAGDQIRLFNARITLAGFQCERLRRCDQARPQLEQARQIAEALQLPRARVEVAQLDARVAEWHGDAAARDAAWQRALDLAAAGAQADAAAEVQRDRARARLRARDFAGAAADARAAGSDDPIANAILAEAELGRGNTDAARAALSAAWAAPTDAPPAALYLAGAAWLAAKQEPAPLAAIGARLGLALDAAT
ncbi:MAG: hypothetical protein ACTHU0_13030 [Kofleriaceae bacterium]